ncbi:hypothetical protein SUGI_0477440 [Cryptomeria japonica]|uniref:cytochrome P450 716B2-like n=1 Tax=Cryptomeria japonica TaxID=3369 RepID=UPI002408B090|nr:cytochrome P450 716B2-like [Cryptomeria japonica]GLJ24946.1 hypothetical protein SUGI_0477440 [Cryptomeria japonica]
MDFEISKLFIEFQESGSLFLILSTAVAVAVGLGLFLLHGRGKNIPPGSVGLPIIGETLQFLRAYREFRHKEWIQERITKYGPVFKTSLMGSPTVVLTGEAGNRFLLQIDYNIMITKQPKSVSRIVGRTNILELCGDEHKRMRSAVMRFLKPDVLKKNVGKTDAFLRQHFAECWEGKESIIVLPLMRQLAFKFACHLVCGLSDTNEREALRQDFLTAIKGMWSLAWNIPGTTFSRSLKARHRIIKRLSLIMEVRKQELQQGKASPQQDLLSCLLTMEDDGDVKALTEEEIMDNIIALLIAGHDTTATLLTHIVRTLALHPNIYQNVLDEQMKIVAEKPPNESLTWEDMQKMKYTWKVAQETARLTPPLVGGFRKAIKDVEYEGYTIPKGWQLFWVTSTTHMDDEIFKNAKAFDPAHFDKAIPPFSYTAFGGGSRFCPGYDFAKLEVIVFVHHLVCKYKWSLVNPDEKIIGNRMPIPAMGLPIKLHPKENI